MDLSVQLLIFVDAVPAAVPAALKAPYNCSIFPAGDRQLHRKAPLSHGSKNGYSQIVGTGFGRKRWNPEMLPDPFQLRKGKLVFSYAYEGLYQGNIVTASHFDQTFMLHGQVSKIFDSRCFFVYFWQGNHFIAGWQIAIHKYTSLMRLTA